MSVPDKSQIEALMKKCQIGCGGRNALDDAHNILADCYGTLGALEAEVRRLREIQSLLEGLVAVVQYRLKGTNQWINTAAFEIDSVAVRYAKFCFNENQWEYRVVDLKGKVIWPKEK